MAKGTQRKLEVEVGISQQTLGAFTLGTATGSISLGRRGAWALEAPGVVDFHAYLYFDGVELFVCSLQPEQPVWVESVPLLAGWCRVPLDCRLMLGQAVLRFSEVAADESIMSVPLPLASGPPPPEFSVVAELPGVRANQRHGSALTHTQALQPARSTFDGSATLLAESGAPRSGVAASPSSESAPLSQTQSLGLSAAPFLLMSHRRSSVPPSVADFKPEPISASELATSTLPGTPVESHLPESVLKQYDEAIAAQALASVRYSPPASSDYPAARPRTAARPSDVVFTWGHLPTSFKALAFCVPVAIAGIALWLLLFR